MIKQTLVPMDHILLKNDLVVGKYYMGIQFTKQLEEKQKGIFIINSIYDLDTFEVNFIYQRKPHKSLISREMIANVIQSNILELCKVGELLLTENNSYLVIDTMEVIDPKGKHLNLINIFDDITFIYKNGMQAFIDYITNGIEYPLKKMDLLWSRD